MSQNKECSGSGDTESALASMRRFHKYLESNYVGGCERFFSPTGFLDEFQRSVEVEVQEKRNYVTVKTMDEAVEVLQPVVAGAQGVFDLASEPGTGKTSELPFKFSDKKVVVALPTPFDAWSAFQTANGSARLRLKGLKLGDVNASVVYTDSYMAAHAMLSGYMEYDVMIVDECDSPRGVTRFLGEVKAPGKLLIRMSASHGRTDKAPSRSFRVEEDDSMPDARENLEDLAKFVESKKGERSLVLMPDADSAVAFGGHLKGASVICAKSDLVDIARVVVNQDGPKLIVADDVCARGLNLNVSVLFDSQLVSEYGSMRNITRAEALQRRGRVGRNKPGKYYSPGLRCAESAENDMDLVRHNVIRSLASVRQKGDQKLKVTEKEAKQLSMSSVEPMMGLLDLRAAGKDMVLKAPFEDKRVVSSAVVSSSSSGSSSVSMIRVSPWLSYFSTGHSDKKEGGKVTLHTARNKNGYGQFVRRRSSLAEGSNVMSRSASEDSFSEESLSKGLKALQVRNNSDRRKVLPLAETAPYAVKSEGRAVMRERMSLPMAPPVMDLTQLTYDMDWPALIRDRLCTGGDLPTLVPPGSWRHTSAGGIGNNWMQRLENLATSETTFSDDEFEVVCRAWNLIVAQAWVRRAPGLSNEANADRVEFCARYFQSYFLLQTAE